LTSDCMVNGHACVHTQCVHMDQEAAKAHVCCNYLQAELIHIAGVNEV
jgi:hypothetical protein